MPWISIRYSKIITELQALPWTAAQMKQKPHFVFLIRTSIPRWKIKFITDHVKSQVFYHMHLKLLKKNTNVQLNLRDIYL